MANSHSSLTTTATPDCQAVLALIPEYAFGLATEDEARFIEKNLPFCAEAAQQLTEFRSLQDVLRVEVPQVEPPASLEERLMARLDDIAPTPALVARPSLPTLRRIHRAWLAFAAAVVLLVISNLFWLARTTMSNPTPMPTNVIFAVENASLVQWTRLKSAVSGKNSAALIMWNKGSSIGMLCAWGLPPLQNGQIYRLWLTDNAQIIPAGTVQVDGQGWGVLIFDMQMPVGAYTNAQITIESASEPNTPTGAPVIQGDI